MTRYDEIKRMYADLGFRFFDAKYALNLYGIRRGYNTVNHWDDILGIAFTDGLGNKVVIEHKGTTKPGLYWLKNKKGNTNGTAILIPGQYIRCWKLGKHNGRYEALVQSGRGNFKVWRDADADGQMDPNGKIYDDVTGLNMHHGADKGLVGAYSAGCQVRQNVAAHEMVMAIVRKAYDFYKNDHFSYTLFEQLKN